MRITHIGEPTVLLEIEGWRLLTDPTFDAPGRTYGFGWGTSSVKLAGPAVAADALGPVDAPEEQLPHKGAHVPDPDPLERIRAQAVGAHHAARLA